MSMSGSNEMLSSPFDSQFTATCFDMLVSVQSMIHPCDTSAKQISPPSRTGRVLMMVCQPARYLNRSRERSRSSDRAVPSVSRYS